MAECADPKYKWAWQKIRNTRDWRGEIYCLINADDFDACNDACIFMTATALRIECHLRDNQVLVYSEGYRNGPAGP